MRDLLYPLGRALQLLGLAVTFVDVVLFFIQSMTMMVLLKIFLFGIATFYSGYFLSGLGTPRPRPIQPENPRTGKKGSREPSGPPEPGDKS
ncbi:MAG: hypothetical protein M0Z25_07755 [Nitrospiraceae bacterium]|nr:hypothetical protein [Nitrospiraceae bacterium]